jgi:hypothetical protein
MIAIVKVKEYLYRPEKPLSLRFPDYKTVGT